MEPNKLKNILIPYGHWPPSNLAGVHRARLIGNFLTQLGYHPIVVTIKPEYYEEKLDHDMLKTVSPDIEVHHVDAKPVGKIRVIGDIGIRGFKPMKAKCLEIIQSRQIDFIWIPIPSFYSSLLGPELFKKTGVPYGIDYIDPWVRDISNIPGWRIKLSLMVAKYLEPKAVKHASLITGVSTPYYQAVLDRNFKNKAIVHAGMPYGFDPNDHKIELPQVKPPWEDDDDVKPWVYAGAFLPNSYLFMDCFFEAIKRMRTKGVWDEQIRLYFVGTGAYQHKSIAEYAQDHGIADIVKEDRSRYPFLHILQYLNRANTVMVIGSTEKHYTASKTYQSLLSEQPVFAMFHGESTATQVMEECKADRFTCRYMDGMEREKIIGETEKILQDRIEFDGSWKPDLKALDKYSALQSAKVLVEKINQIID